MRLARSRSASVALLAALFFARPGGAELPGSEAPDFALKSVDGPNLRLSEFRGQVVLLSFWASWCGECRSQLRSLADLYDRYRGAGFEMLAISLDRDRHDASDATAALDPGFPVLHDAGGVVGEQYQVDSMPYLVLIDRDGIVRAEFEGFRRGQEDEYLEEVRLLLNE